jgi:glycosyltransferase involved in cell wall biosynthesis
MKIAFFTDTYEPQKNGVVTSIDLFKNELERQGHRVLIFCPKSAELSGREDVVQFRSVTFKPYPEYRLAMPSPRILLALRKFRPDVIHAHSPGPIGIAGLSAAKMLKIPFVFTYHTDLSNYTDYIPFKTFGKTSMKVLLRLLNTFMENCDLVIFPGEEIRKRFRKATKLNTAVLPTGITAKVRSHQKPKERYVLQVGRLCKERRIDVLLRAFKAVNGGMKLYITSDGPDKGRLEDLARRLGMSESVKFLGYVSEKEKIELYRKAEIFVTPSPTDTQGLVALEAMQYGTPVIAAHAGGFLDYIKDGKNGLFFRQNDPHDLAKKMRHLLKDRGLWRKLSRNGYATVKQFDMKTLSKKLVSIYKGDVQRKTVTVVMPARNEEDSIEGCLKALRKQTIRPEIIVIDGKSIDRTAAIAKKYADRVVSDNGKGIAYARNLGWKIAKGEIVAYCDADSRPPADWVENITRLMRDNAAVHGPIVPYDSGMKTRLNLKIWGDWFMRAGSKLRYPVICAANVAFRKDMLSKYPFRLNAPIEDFDVGRRMRHGGRIKCYKQLTMPISGRRYKRRFYTMTARQYLTNYFRVKMGMEPKNFGYFEKKS